MRAFIRQEFKVEYLNGIFAPFDRRNLSHQKALFDYQNADLQEQVHSKVFLYQVEEHVQDFF